MKCRAETVRSANDWFYKGLMKACGYLINGGVIMKCLKHGIEACAACEVEKLNKKIDAAIREEKHERARAQLQQEREERDASRKRNGYLIVEFGKDIKRKFGEEAFCLMWFPLAVASRKYANSKIFQEYVDEVVFNSLADENKKIVALQKEVFDGIEKCVSTLKNELFMEFFAPWKNYGKKFHASHYVTLPALIGGYALLDYPSYYYMVAFVGLMGVSYVISELKNSGEKNVLSAFRVAEKNLWSELKWHGEQEQIADGLITALDKGNDFAFAKVESLAGSADFRQRLVSGAREELKKVDELLHKGGLRKVVPL